MNTPVGGFQMPGLTNPALPSVGSQFGTQGLNYQPFQMPGSAGAVAGNTPFSLGGMFQGAGSKIGSVLNNPTFGKGLGAFSTLASIYTGFKGLGLAKDQLSFQKKSFNKNFNASAKSYNNQLADQWAARNASASNRGQSYQGMDQWLSGRTIKESGKGSG